MTWSIRIARIMGIDVFLHFTFLILVAWVGVSTYLYHRDVNEAIYGIAFILSVFGIVVLHEFGHAIAASWFGIKTRDITLYPIGGVARLERMPEEPFKEFVVAIAGPMVNVILAIAIYFMLPGIPDPTMISKVEDAGSRMLEQLFLVNVGLVVFNMIPAFPMDGGRVLRAVLASFLGYARATQIAAGLGQALAFGLGFLGLMNGNLILIFIAFFVLMAAGQEAQAVQLKTSLAGVPVADAMITNYQALRPEEPLSAAVDHLLSGFQTDFPVLHNGQVVGMLLRHDLIEKIRKDGEHSRIQDAMRTQFVMADPTELLEQAFVRLQDCECRSMPVIHQGRLVGLLTPDNVGEFLMLREALRRAT